MGSKSAAKSLMEKAGVPLTPGYHGDDQDPALLAKEAARIGYPVLIKATRRRRRQGHAPGRRRGEFAAALASCQREAKSALRRRPRAGRAVRAAAAAHRDPGVRRQPRRLRLPVRARLLGAAPPPEGARGGAGAGHDRRAPRGDGPGGGGGGAGGRLRRRRHGRVHRPSGRPLLLHGDEHPAAGRASGHRDDHRARPGRVAVARRRRRAAAACSRASSRSPAMRSRPGSTPRTPTAASCLPPASWCIWSRRRKARACASTPASSRATRSRRSTTR